mgnify:CR=1 FL=1
MTLDKAENHKIYTGSAVSQIDRNAIEHFAVPSYALMCEAGAIAFEQLKVQFPQCNQIVILCGTGNNGGDGYVVAQLAQSQGYDVQVIAPNPPGTPDAIRACNDYLESGGSIRHDVPTALTQQAVIVDALLGTGIKDSPREPFASLIRWANEQTCSRMAIDVPSGVDSDTGKVYGDAFNANLSLTFIAHKLGLLTGPAANFTGRVILKSLTLPQAAAQNVSEAAHLLLQPTLNHRQPDTHKGSYGHALIIGGSTGMLGAGILASEAALRNGAGKVHLLSDHPLIALASVTRPEIMTADLSQVDDLLAKISAVAIGPGLGHAESAKQLLCQALAANKPTVIDADGLGLLKTTLTAAPNTRVPSACILTPHPGEAAFLLDTTISQIQNDRLAAATEIAQRFSAVCVLKGHGTLIAALNTTTLVCNIGNPGMATAGTGDVLTGILVALLAQGYSAIKAAEIGVWLHSRAADIALNSLHPSSLLASDITHHLSDAWREAS